MSEQTCTDKEIKKQLDAMPLEEFEDFLKGVAVTKGHEGRPQHAELLSQLKHNVKVQPDEPIQTKATDKDCRTFWKSLNQKENQHLPDNASSTISTSSSAGKCTTFNGNILYSGSHLTNYNHHKHSSLLGPGSTSNRSFSNTGDQNANPVSSSGATTDALSSTYAHQFLHNSVQEKFNDYNNHHHVPKSTLSYNNSLDGDPGGFNSRRSQERDISNKNNDNTRSNSSVSGKNALNSTAKAIDDDDDTQETYLEPAEFTGVLPPQYVMPSVTKHKDLSSLHVYPKPTPNQSMTPLHGSSIQPSSSTHSVSSISSRDDTQERSNESTSSSKQTWDLSRLNNRRTELLQLKDGYKSVSSVTSGDAPSYMGTASSSSNEETYGTIQAVSPTMPTTAIVSKSPTIDGSQLDKPTVRRGADRKKKSSKHVLRETLINPQEMPGYKGTEEDIDKLLEFVEGNQTKSKKSAKDKRQRDGKLNKGNEKQVLSKAASLDENSLGYGSKKTGEESIGTRGVQNRNSKDVEKKNCANITKSASAICADDASILRTSDAGITSPIPAHPQEPKSSSSSVSSTCSSSFSSTKSASLSHSLVNGDSPPLGPKVATSKTVAVSNISSGGNKTALSAMPKSQTGALGTEGDQSSNSQTQSVSLTKSEVSSVASSAPTVIPQTIQGKTTINERIKSEDDRLERPDEGNPYVLVQKKKKREQKKYQQRETENFNRSHPEQARRDGVRQRRSNAERRKSVGSVPGSENEGSDDDDSVRSLPAGECTPRERIPKPCSSSGGTPQTSYADIARMSKGENEKTVPTSTNATSPSIPVVPCGPKTPTPSAKSNPVSVAAVVTSPEDMNFPALSPPTSSEKIVANPVNAAVWPCRPRIMEMETSVIKDKQGTLINNNNNNNNNLSNKSDEITSSSSCNNKDESFPPVVSIPSTVSVSSDSQQKCSMTKELSIVPVINKASVPDSVNQINNNNNKDLIMIPRKPLSDTRPSQKVESPVVQNGVLPRNNAVLDIAPKVANKARLEEKKAKDKSTKPVLDEYVNKHQVSSVKHVSENGDLHLTEPVVFCGGKFDSTQLPVGQKIGFEFGFGVNEALIDNTTVSENSVPGPKSMDFSAVLKNTDINHASIVPSEVTRSQDRIVSLSHHSSSNEKSMVTKKELPNVGYNEKPFHKQSHQQKLNTVKNRGQQSLTTSTGVPPPRVPRAASTDSVPPNQQNPSIHQKTSQPSAESVSKSVESVAVSSSVQGQSVSNLCLSSGTSTTADRTAPMSSQSTLENTSLKESGPKVDIAQLFKPPTGVTVPESVLQAPAFMEDYISRLTTLKEQGKISIHRVA